jgi:myo-inositol-1-phosphate synthase
VVYISNLKWVLDLSNGLYQPKYTAAHCSLKYEMNVHIVTIRVLKLSKKKLKDESRAKRVVKSNEKAQKRREKVQIVCEPRAILMAKALKEKNRREQKAHFKDNTDEEVKVIKELESQGDLKEDVPIGGEEFEDEEPRQGE